MVKDIRTNNIWVFEVDRWFALSQSTENIEYTVYITTDLNYNWKKYAKEYVGTGMREKHLWASVLIR